MFDSLKTSLIRWNETTNSRAKLQHTYAVTAVALVVAAGVFGLVNYQIGQYILTAAIISAVVFLCNGVVWALLQSVIIERLRSNVKVAEKPVRKK